MNSKNITSTSSNPKNSDIIELLVDNFKSYTYEDEEDYCPVAYVFDPRDEDLQLSHGVPVWGTAFDRDDWVF